MPIHYQGGHWRSERTQAEDAALLERDMEALSEEERRAVQVIFQDMASSEGDLSLLQTIGLLEWQRTPVDMKTFVMDPYYLGNTCDNLYPAWLEDLTDLFSGGYREAIFTGAIGTGKTFAASIGICRILYILSCMKDPHRSFGIAANSNISIVALSVNEVLATKVAYENVATKIEASPYFQENFPFEKTKKELRFPRHIWVAARASNDGSVLGLNVIGGLLDEVNFMPRASKGQDPRFNLMDRAEVLYNAMLRRMKSRFERKGKLPGTLFVISSKQTHDDFTAKRILSSRSDSSVFVRDYSLWDAKPEAYAAGEWFHVVVGNEQAPSRIVPEDTDIEEVAAVLPEDCVIIDVPVDFRSDFETDLEGAIRDLAGVATVTVSPYIQRRTKIIDAIRKDLVHPFSVESYDPSQPGYFHWHRMVRINPQEGVSRPIVSPYAPRHIHIDPSSTGDATGFAMGHVAGWKEIVRRDDDGNQYPERAPEIVMDVLLQIVPPAGGEIILGDVRKLVYQLSKHGYMITCVSIDSWNSVEAIQKLSQRGFNAMQLSVDRTLGPYDMLKSALYEDRLFYYDYPPLLQELRELEHDRHKRKIDHPLRGSKDVADAVAGVVWTLIENSSHYPLSIMRGVSQAPDVWMMEHQQSALARSYGSEDVADTGNSPLLPAFLLGSGEFDGGGSDF
jgi:hypothetical protein